MRTKTIGTSLTNKEHSMLMSALHERGQTITEYGLMSLGVVLSEQRMIEKRERDGKVAKVVSIKVSDKVFNDVLALIETQGCSKTDLVFAVFKDLLVG